MNQAIRKLELRKMLCNPLERWDVERAFLDCFPIDQKPGAGYRVIQTILDHEYPAGIRRGAGRGLAPHSAVRRLGGEHGNGS